MTGKARKRDAFDIKVRDIFEANRKIYGSRRISKEVKRLGINSGRYKARQAMARLGLEVRYPKKFKVTTDSDHNHSIFRSLKHEELNYENFRTKEAAKLSIIDYLAFYNGKRAHSKLGYQSPLQFEREFYRKVS